RGASIIPPSSVETTRTTKESADEKREVSRNLAVLALAWVNHDEHLSVREREGVRRGYATAAGFLGWTTLGKDPVAAARKDVLKLARAGHRILARELADEVDQKQKELAQLRQSGKALEKLAEENDFEEPVEFTYVHTARKPSQGLVTKTELLTLNDAAEATKAALMIENKSETWRKLRDEMQGDLKVREEQLDEMKRNLPAFVEAFTSLLQHVFATLY
ncbi:MAG: hypothetical protein ACC682_12950, partial [Gemmatimonadota bacterium]